MSKLNTCPAAKMHRPSIDFSDSAASTSILRQQMIPSGEI
jgi:hypothetical protein